MWRRAVSTSARSAPRAGSPAQPKPPKAPARRKMLVNQLLQKGKRNSPTAERDVLATVALLDAGGAKR